MVWYNSLIRLLLIHLIDSVSLNSIILAYLKRMYKHLIVCQRGVNAGTTGCKFFTEAYTIVTGTPQLVIVTIRIYPNLYF